jgi:hypothetical protein
MFRLLAAIGVIFLVGASGCTRSEPKTPSSEPGSANRADSKADLKWAKDGAIDFLTAVKNHKYHQAGLLLSAKMTQTVGLRPDIGASIRDEYSIPWQLSSWSFTSEEMAPDKNEASFRGKLISGEKGEAEFVIRLAKEKDNGMWRVNFLSNGDWKKAETSLKK